MFCTELDFIRKLFHGNSHPCLYIDKCFRIKLDPIFNPPKPKIAAKNKYFFVSTPFLYQSSNFTLKNHLPNTVLTFSPHPDLKDVFHK